MRDTSHAAQLLFSVALVVAGATPAAALSAAALPLESPSQSSQEASSSSQLAEVKARVQQTPTTPITPVTEAAIASLIPASSPTASELNLSEPHLIEPNPGEPDPAGADFTPLQPSSFQPSEFQPSEATPDFSDRSSAGTQWVEPALTTPERVTSDLIQLSAVESRGEEGVSAPLQPERLAQLRPLPPGVEIPPGTRFPNEEDLPDDTDSSIDVERDDPLPDLPPAEDLLPSPSSPSLPPDTSGDEAATIEVKGYRVVGSTVFDEDELAEITDKFTGKVTFAQLLQARSEVTALYVNNGYVTSGAFIPPQTLTDGIVTIEILEGSLEDIRVSGTNKLYPYYVRSRLALAGATPLNVNQLLEGLKLLQLDPLLDTISADLQAGIQPGTSLLEVVVSESDPFSTTFGLDNGRSPSVGTFRRKVQFDHNNLVGLGDRFSLAYSNTDGSDSLDLAYTVPFNAKDGTIRLAHGRTRSNVIEDPFTPLDINARSKYYEATVRQPLERTANKEIALGLTFSRQESQTRLGFSDIGPFPLSPGASDDGETKGSALRFFQEWSDRNSQQVLAARSQLSWGVPWFDATKNADGEPDSDFFTWRLQGQWVRLLAEDSLLLVKGEAQIADRQLLSLEQFGIGGGNSVRGYRQDATLADNGVQFTTEVRLPIARIPSIDGVLQIAPFLDVGKGWNNTAPHPENQFLVGTGLGLVWRHGNNFNARFDWGYPLVNRSDNRKNWQENGLYFNVTYTPF